MLTAAIILGGLAFAALFLGLAYLRLKSAVEGMIEPNLDAWNSPPAHQPYDDRRAGR